jgi:hypothetical protein
MKTSPIGSGGPTGTNPTGALTRIVHEEPRKAQRGTAATKSRLEKSGLTWPGGAATKKASLFGGLMVVDEAIFFPEQRRHE